MKAFVVNSKDLFDTKKNPNLSLSPREIIKNKKIKKHFVNKHNYQNKQEFDTWLNE